MSAVKDLLGILKLEPLEHNLFRGRTVDVDRIRIFGGQVVAQALSAAYETVSQDRLCHSLHSYFLRGGDPKAPIVFDVDRIRDGRSFTTRRVVAIQHGEAIFSMAASFHLAEEGCDHAMPMPDVPSPDQLIGQGVLSPSVLAQAPEAVQKYLARSRPVELLPTSMTHYVSPEKLEPHQHVWMRMAEPLPEPADPRLNQCVLAYISDMALVDTSLFPHGISIFDTRIQGASLDHSIWFHRPMPSSGWLLYSQDSPSAEGARGFARGSFFTEGGQLLASTAQEGLIRWRRLAAD